MSGKRKLAEITPSDNKTKPRLQEPPRKKRAMGVVPPYKKIRIFKQPPPRSNLGPTDNKAQPATAWGTVLQLIKNSGHHLRHHAEPSPIEKIYWELEEFVESKNIATNRKNLIQQYLPTLAVRIFQLHIEQASKLVLHSNNKKNKPLEASLRQANCWFNLADLTYFAYARSNSIKNTYLLMQYIYPDATDKHQKLLTRYLSKVAGCIFQFHLYRIFSSSTSNLITRHRAEAYRWLSHIPEEQEKEIVCQIAEKNIIAMTKIVPPVYSGFFSKATPPLAQAKQSCIINEITHKGP